MTRSEEIARLSVALETFKMAADNQLTYPHLRAYQVDSIYTDGSNSGGQRYTWKKDAVGEIICLEPLVQLGGALLVVYRVANEGPESTSYGAYSGNGATYARLTIDEVAKLFLRPDSVAHEAYFEGVVSVITIAASQLSPVPSK